MGSLRQADGDGLVAWPAGSEVEYWGATGPKFRNIRWQGGALRASGTALADVHKINVAKREVIAPGDFDILVFYGSRLRVAEFMLRMSDWRYRTGSWPSQAVLTAAAEKFTSSVRSFHTCAHFAQARTPVYFVPSPLYTDGIVNMMARGAPLHQFPKAIEAQKEDRDILWSTLQTLARSRGFEVVRQPEDTIANGVFTKTEYACEGAADSGDFGHKSPAFAARWMQELVPLLPAQPRAA